MSIPDSSDQIAGTGPPLVERTLDPDAPSVPWPVRFAGGLDVDPRHLVGRRGRTRRWSYTGAGADELLVGAAIVDLGFAATAFAWALVGEDLHAWEARGVPFRHVRMGATADVPSSFRRSGDRVAIAADGSLDLDVAVDAGRLRVTTSVRPDTPVVLGTDTPAGGWNATQKVAGERAHVVVSVDGVEHETDGGTWRDWTLGAQDRHTSWRWAAGCGTTPLGGRVGLNLSTGMNASGPGEDVVWWDGTPHPLQVDVLAPLGADADGPWRTSGPGWSLDFEPLAVRAATESLLVVRSQYVQPIGTFRGHLPGPDGTAVEVRLVGVTEDHEARW